MSNYGEGNTALEKEDAQGNLKQYRRIGHHDQSQVQGNGKKFDMNLKL